MISYEDYKKLLAAGQKYVTQAQAADPEWAAFNQHAASLSAENMGELGASPTKDYWTQYLGTLTPEQAAGFQQHMSDSSSWTDKVGSVLKYAIPAAVGGAGLAATGLLGTAAQGFVGGGALGGTGATGAAAALPAFDTGVGGLFGSQAAIDSALASGATGLGSTAGVGGGALLGMGGVAAPALTEGFLGSTLAGLGGAGSAAGSALGSLGDIGSQLGSAGGGALDWIKNNPGLVSLLGGALAGAGAGSSQSTKPQKQYAPQPGLQMGLLQQPTLNQSPGLFTMGQGHGLANSGLARFGAQGGQFTPTAYNPQSFQWGQR